ncbi:hypothetical protein CSH63_29250 [Micromonospora tulbaghiae]|uniref:Uncharacterized protein n=1 Tax=Micromonospora tulbaghiae TaxID=479978 RepID=A0A386WTE0_9ACTN|nr:hypothetical protein [Micromonospora tulbaghiae]AYF31461.1 hypothetical protein CSH63_29250 [Micromonospora tulbaghiae]
MTIIASAHVPASSRLVDAPTADLTAVRATSDLARQAYTLLDAGTAIPEVATRLGVSEAEAVALSIDHVARQTGWDRGVGLRPVDPYENRPGNPALCPTWCVNDHTTDEPGESVFHDRPIATVTAHTYDLPETVRTAVAVGSCDDHAAGEHEPPSVKLDVSLDGPGRPVDLTVLAGLPDRAIRQVAARALAGDWQRGETLRLTPEQAAHLGRALLDAAHHAGQAN